MYILNTQSVSNLACTIFPQEAEKVLPLFGVICWVFFIILAVLAVGYMIFNIINNKIKLKRIKERELLKPKLIISQRDFLEKEDK